ncbi:hypothetical protein EDD17DRAFT_1754536 [Pisolithus thermaeus]|nr:hypothetical protein EV401DRAFT_1885331 [Pisolithus croceorrhizus]KAI6165318.1 hypothetical protein EDD17DRAFT_1754536 [Pisolithus thermaeus]
MANKRPQLETKNDAMGETDVEKSPPPKKGKKEKKEKKGQVVLRLGVPDTCKVSGSSSKEHKSSQKLSWQPSLPPPSPSPPSKDMEVDEEPQAETDYEEGLEVIEAGLLETAESTQALEETVQTTEWVARATPTRPPSNPGKVRGTLVKSIHAPSMSGTNPKPPTPRPPPAPLAHLASKPALEAKTMVSLAERLATRQQAILEKEKSEPWVFRPKPRGTLWPRKGYCLDVAAPYRASKESKIQDLIDPHNTIWGIPLGGVKHKSRLSLCCEGVKAFLMEKQNMENPEVKVLAETGVWSLIQLPTPEVTSALVDQQVILHRNQDTALFYYLTMHYLQPVQYVCVPIRKQGMTEIKEIFLNDHKKAFALVREKMATFFGVPEERIERVPDFDTRYPDKIGIWVCLVDPAKCQDMDKLEDEEMDRILAWAAMWGTRKSILTISSKPTIDVHMAYPCNMCHSGDHQDPNCPWSQKGFLGEGRVLKIVPRREG